jgi:hypothetical protein
MWCLKNATVGRVEAAVRRFGLADQPVDAGTIHRCHV